VTITEHIGDNGVVDIAPQFLYPPRKEHSCKDPPTHNTHTSSSWSCKVRRAKIKVRFFSDSLAHARRGELVGQPASDAPNAHSRPARQAQRQRDEELKRQRESVRA